MAALIDLQLRSGHSLAVVMIGGVVGGPSTFQATFKSENIGNRARGQGAYETAKRLAICRKTVQYQAGASVCGNLV